MNGLSERLRYVLAFIDPYGRDKGTSPGIVDVARYVGATTSAVTSGTLASLVRKGYLVNRVRVTR